MFKLSVRILATALLGLGLVPLTASIGQAHSQLVSSTPTNGATLATAPAEVVFTFDENLLPDLDTISINTERGENVASKQVEPVANSISMPWPNTITSGTYQVAYRIVSGDGHPVTGAITFTIGTASASPDVTNSVAPTQDGPPTATVISIVAFIAAALSIGLIVMLVRRGNSKS